MHIPCFLTSKLLTDIIIIIIIIIIIGLVDADSARK
jgi:hypothetical protein